MSRFRRVQSEREQEKLLDEFVTKGYKIKEQSQYSAKVKKKDWGSVPVHGFAFLFAFLGAAVLLDAAGASSGGAWIAAVLANVGYAAYSYVTAEEVVIKVDSETDG